MSISEQQEVAAKIFLITYHQAIESLRHLLQQCRQTAYKQRQLEDYQQFLAKVVQRKKNNYFSGQGLLFRTPNQRYKQHPQSDKEMNRQTRVFQFSHYVFQKYLKRFDNEVSEFKKIKQIMEEAVTALKKQKDKQTNLWVFYYPAKIEILAAEQHNNNNVLSVTRQHVKFTEKKSDAEKLSQDKDLIKKDEFEMLLGCFRIKRFVFLLFVKQAKKICTIEMNHVYQIVKVEWVQLKLKFQIGEYQQTEEDRQAVGGLLQTGGYYYCNGYDLSKSKQYAQTHQEYQEKFVWNHNLLKYLIYENVSKLWLQPVIQGYVGSLQHTFLNNSTEFTIQYILISRRSSKRAGTRFYSRGVDDEGKVSNYVQSQQLIYTNKYVMSHVQIRGSVPVFWQQIGMDGIASKLKISRSAEMTQKAFYTHFLKLRSQYKLFLCINLLSKKKNSEAELTEFYELMMKQLSGALKNFVKYEYFDFHDKCGNDKFSEVNPLIFKMKDINESFKFYFEDKTTKKIHWRQQGIMRNNCLDCLDRTNFVQTKLAIQIFEFMLTKMGIQFQSNLVENMDKPDSIELVKKFTSVWADNGDSISMQYTGIGSTHTDITREGKRTWIGFINHKWRSINRFFHQFSDQKKQETINTLLGYNSKEQDINKIIQLKHKERQVSKVIEKYVAVVSWNINYSKPQPDVKLMKKYKEADLVVLALQNITKADKKEWETNVNALFQPQYLQVCRKSSNGSLTLIYLKEDKQLDRRHISQISHCKFKFNTMSLTRGVILSKLSLHQTTFLFINFNFLNAKQLFQYSKIFHESAFQNSSLGVFREGKIQVIDYKLLTGSVGSSFDSQNQTITKLAYTITNTKINTQNYKQRQQAIDKLYDVDVLDRDKDSDTYLSKYNEKSINFSPTGKFFKGKYKEEVSWANRILVWNYEEAIVKQFDYSAIDIETEYKPVAALYKLEIYHKE